MQGSIPVSYTHLEQFEKLKVALSEAGVPNIPDYEDVIRPFNVNKDVEFTDIWTFENVRQYNCLLYTSRCV